MFIRKIAVSAATALLFAVGNAAATDGSPFPSGGNNEAGGGSPFPSSASESGDVWIGNVGPASVPGRSIDVSVFPSGSNESGGGSVALMHSKASGTASVAIRKDENYSGNGSPFPSTSSGIDG